MERMTNSTLSPESILSTLIDTCRKAGATDADASYSRADGVSIEVLNGKLEGIERSESQGVSLRCFFGQQNASVSGSDTSADGLKTLAERCVAMAKVVPEDPYCGLADAADFPFDSDGYKAPTPAEDFIDGIGFDGRAPNAYLDSLTIGLKTGDTVQGGEVLTN